MADFADEERAQIHIAVDIILRPGLTHQSRAALEGTLRKAYQRLDRRHKPVAS